jgi:hypothetical protein
MQSVDLAVHDEPATEIPEQTEVPRVRASLPPQFEECCYPFGEPRTHGSVAAATSAVKASSTMTSTGAVTSSSASRRPCVQSPPAYLPATASVSPSTVAMPPGVNVQQQRRSQPPADTEPSLVCDSGTAAASTPDVSSLPT